LILQEGEIWDPSHPLVFCGASDCQYIFHETAAVFPDNSDDDPLVVATARHINTTAVCSSWTVIDGGDGNQGSITLDTEPGPKEITLPTQGGTDQTTFITNVTLSCGPGCSTVSTLETSGKSPWYYDCNITVGQVQDGIHTQHQVGDSVRSMASGGIALQGFAVSSIANDVTLQYHSYPAESVFGISMNGSTSSMVLLLARFAIGVIAVTAESNSRFVIDGFVPQRASRLEVDYWGYASMILFFLAAMHLVVELIAMVLIRQIVVPSGGPIAVAQVLQSVTSQLCPSHGEHVRGSCSTCIVKGRWIYRSKMVSNKDTY
jgi:hypothetical protein